MLAIGLDFILGYAGQLNLGHSAFYGICAEGFDAPHHEARRAFLGRVPLWHSSIGDSRDSAVDLRRSFARPLILAIASLGFAVIVDQVLVNWISLTQGPLGIYGIKPPPAIALPGLPAVSFSDLANMFYLVAGFALLFYTLLDRLVHSPIGETLTAIREDEVSAASLGINCTAWKVFAFGIGAAVAGAAGAFYASFVGTLVPDAFDHHRVFYDPCQVIAGGKGNADRPGLRRHPTDGAARGAARVWRFSACALRRCTHSRRLVLCPAA